MDTLAAAERASYQRELQALRMEVEFLRRYAGVKGRAEELAEMARTVRVPIGYGPDNASIAGQAEAFDKFTSQVLTELREREDDYLIRFQYNKEELIQRWDFAVDLAVLAFLWWKTEG